MTSEVKGEQIMEVFNKAKTYELFVDHTVFT